MIENLIVDRETAVEKWGLPYDPDEAEGIEVISNEPTGDKARWTQDMKLVVKIKGQLYISYYRTGLTEYQEEDPWDCNKTVSFAPAEALQVTVTAYREIG